METLFAVLHVTAAVFIIGPLTILPMTGMRAIRTGQAGQVAGLAKSTALLGWLSLLVAVFGFGLVAFVPKEDNLSFSTPWLVVSIILYALAVTISLSVTSPALAKAGRELAAGGTGRYRLVGITSGVVALLLVAVVVLMVARPGGA